jgi:hypothetical protein
MTKWPFGTGDEGRKNIITAAVIAFAFASLLILGQSPQLAVALGFAATGLTAVLAMPERKRNGTADRDTEQVAQQRREPARDVEVRPPSADSRRIVAWRHLGLHRCLGRANAA